MRKIIISFLEKFLLVLKKNDTINIKENIDNTIRCSKCNAPYIIQKQDKTNCVMQKAERDYGCGWCNCIDEYIKQYDLETIYQCKNCGNTYTGVVKGIKGVKPSGWYDDVN